MKPVHWLFVLSMGFFVSGLAFVITSAGQIRQETPTPPIADSLTPVASYLVPAIASNV